MYSWGSNVKKSLGINDLNTASAYFTPVKVSDGSFIINEVVCGDEHVIVRSNATAFAGFGNVAYMGANSTESYITFKSMRAVEALGFTNVWAQGLTTFYKDGANALWSSGENTLGQLGEAGGASRIAVAKNPVVTGINMVKMAGSVKMTVGLDIAGAVWISGANDYGELGNNVTNNIQPTADFIKQAWYVNNGVVVSKMWHGYRSTFTLSSTGVLHAFGNNTSGQLGTETGVGGFVMLPEVIPIVGIVGNIVEIAIGYSHTLLRTDAGHVYCTGNNTLGSCGVDTLVEQYNAFIEVGGVQPMGAASIAVQDKTSFAILTTGVVRSWGDYVKTGLQVNFHTPAVLSGSVSFQKVYCGDRVSFGLTPYVSSLYGWGINVGQQLTTDDRTDRVAPLLIPHTATMNFTDFGVVGVDPTYTAIGVKDSQYFSLVGWGYNDKGQLGSDNNPITPDSYATATEIRTTSVNITTKRLTMGTRHTAVVGSYSPLKAPLGIHAFGDNQFGQIGQGGQGENAKRLQLSDGVVDAAAGDYHTIWISSGLLSVTGKNDVGQIGLGTVVQIGVPQTLNVSAGTLSKVWCGSFSSFVLASDGFYVAGDNTKGALGLPLAQVYNTFTKHSFGTFFSEGVLKVAGSVGEGQHNLVVTTSGKIYSMGLNNRGQLGIGSFVDTLTPTLISPSGLPTDYKALDACAGADHSLVVYGKRSCPADCKGTGTDPKGTCDTVLGKCNCFAGFIGTSCELFQCSDPICSGYGACDQTKGICVCQTNFEGDTCQFRKCPNACSGKGSCDRTTGICTCEAGYIGIDCSTNSGSVTILSLLVIAIVCLLL